MMTSVALSSLVLSCLSYFLAAFLYALTFFKSDSGSENKAFAWMRLGFACASIYLGIEAGLHGFSFPIWNFAHVLVFFAWAIAFLYLIPLSRMQARSFGLVLAPGLFILHLTAIMHANDPAYHLNVQIYFTLHILFAFFAYASFMLSFTAALLYLIQHYVLKRRYLGVFYQKLPSLEVLDQLTYQPIIFGIILLVCAVAVGMLWSHDTSGQILLNDPKTFLTFITIGLYGFLISLRFGTGMRNSRLAMLCILIFAFMISGFVGGRYMKERHGDVLGETKIARLQRPSSVSAGGSL